MDLLLIAAVYLVVAVLILAFNHGAHKNDKYDYGFYDVDSSPQTIDAPIILVADDDFLEHLHEMGFDDTIELEEALIEWDDWAAENLE